MSRLDIVVGRQYTTREGEVKTSYTKIGTAWPFRDKPGYRLVFDALPTPSLDRDGKLETTAMMLEPRQDDRPAQRHQAPPRGRPAPAARDDFSDEVPF